MKIKNSKILPIAALFGAAFIWGVSFVVMKGTLDGIAPGQLLAVRFTMAFLFLGLVFFKKWKLFNLKYIIPGLITGLCLAIAYTVQTYGLNFTTPGKNAFLTAVYCILVPFIYWFVKKEKPDIYNILAALFCVAGIGFVSFENGDGFFLGKGDWLTLMCTVFYAAHMVLIAVYVKKLDMLLLTIVQFGFAAASEWLFTLIFEGAPTAITGNMISDLLFLGIGASAIALMLQNFGIEHSSPSSAAIILSFESVFGVLFSIILGSEDGFNVFKAIGFLLVFTSIIISETKLSFLKKKNKNL